MSKREIERIRKAVQRLVLLTPDTCCEECGKHKGSSKRNFHRHHIIPITEGTEDDCIDPSNIKVVCWKCHIKIHLSMGTWSHGLEYDAVAAD